MDEILVEHPPKRLSKLFVIYCLIAGFATGINIVVATVLRVRWHMWVWSATALGYGSGMLLNFLLNKYLNFAGKGRTFLKQARTFFVVALIGLGMNSLLMEFFVNILHLVWLLALALSIGITMFWSFWGHNAMTFKGGFRAFISQRLKRSDGL
jgi:putative flippase GtrA